MSDIDFPKKALNQRIKGKALPPQKKPDLAVFSRKNPEKASIYMGFYREGPEEARTYMGFYREVPEKAPTYMGFYREVPEKAPTYIGFYREGPEKAPSSIEKAPRRPRLTLIFTGKAPLTPFGFYKSKWRRIAFELAFEVEKLIMPRCVKCAIISVVAWVSLKRGGSGFVWDAPTCFEETWRLWLNHFWLQKTYAIWQTCWSTPPVPSNLVHCPAMLKQQQKLLQTQVSILLFGRGQLDRHSFPW